MRRRLVRHRRTGGSGPRGTLYSQVTTLAFLGNGKHGEHDQKQEMASYSIAIPIGVVLGLTFHSVAVSAVMSFAEQELRLTPREVEEIEAELNAEPAVAPGLAAAIRAARADVQRGRFVVLESD